MFDRPSSTPEARAAEGRGSRSDTAVAFGTGGSPRQRGLAMVTGFWLVIVALLGARVAMFDEISAARVAGAVSAQVASLASVLR